LLKLLDNAVRVVSRSIIRHDNFDFAIDILLRSDREQRAAKVLRAVKAGYEQRNLRRTGHTWTPQILGGLGG
jgi:hypothetical protein